MSLDYSFIRFRASATIHVNAAKRKPPEGGLRMVVREADCTLIGKRRALLKLVSPSRPGVRGEDYQSHLPNALRRDFSRLLFPASSLPPLPCCPKAWWFWRPKATYWSCWLTRLLVLRRSDRTLLLLREPGLSASSELLMIVAN